MNDRDKFIHDNLPGLCREIIGWKKTGVLTGDLLRELADKHFAVQEHHALPLAEEAVKTAALQFAIDAY